MGRDILEHMLVALARQIATEIEKEEQEEHTTCTSWVSVLEPGSANILILVIHAELQIGDSLSQSDTGNDSRKSRTDDDHSYGTEVVNRAVLYDISIFHILVGISFVVHRTRLFRV